MPQAGSLCAVQTAQFPGVTHLPALSPCAGLRLRPEPPRPRDTVVCCVLHSLPWKAWARELCSLHCKVRLPRPPARLESKDRGCIFPYHARALDARLKVKCFSRNLARRESATEDPARPTHSLRLSLSCARRRAEGKKVNLQDFRTFPQSFLAAVLGEERVLVVN